MKTIEYQDIQDRSRWEQEEIIPEDERTLDKVQWQDETTGMPCLLVRNHSGNWCGYVGVVQGHPLFGMPYSALYGGDDGYDSYSEDQRRMFGEVDNASHGGITFTSYCAPNDKEHGICHLVEPGENDRVWWLGFDCGHSGDAHPAYTLAGRIGGTYRTKDYVQGICRRMAKVLKEQA
jgi:hypothetical protein